MKKFVSIIVATMLVLMATIPSFAITNDGISSETEAQIQQSVYSKYIEDKYPNATADDITISYFATASDSSILFRYDFLGTIQVIEQVKIGDYTYSYTCGEDLHLFKNGEAYKLKEAYESGIIDDNMLAELANMNIGLVKNAVENPVEKNKLTQLIQYHDSQYSMWGSLNPYIIDEAYQAYIESKQALQNADSTETDYANATQSLVNADLNKIYIRPEYAQETYNNAVKEQNYNNFYSDDDWTAYQNCLDDLKAELDKITNVNECSQELTNAFHGVLKSYNKMTNSYVLKGDVNKDGAVNISDVTLLQKSLAGLYNLTGAQKMLSGARFYEDLSITNVTDLSKFIAFNNVSLPSENVFIADLDKSFVDENLLLERTFNFSICPRTCNESQPVILKNGESSLQILYGYYQYCDENGYTP